MRTGFARGNALLFGRLFVHGTRGARRCTAKKEYLSQAEAEQIRDAGMSGPRIGPLPRHTREIASRNCNMNSRTWTRPTRSEPTGLTTLINAYTGCIDDAADLIDIGIEKQEDIRQE